MKLKDQIVIISKKNMDSMNALYGKCTTDELERIVNNMIDNAVIEINEDSHRLHMNKIVILQEICYLKKVVTVLMGMVTTIKEDTKDE